MSVRRGEPASPDEQAARDLLRDYQLAAQPIFVIGTLDKGVTVLSQQTRALNLVWALVHSGSASTDEKVPRLRIAIVGGGFAGLTAAAALLKKDVNADLTIFERRDTALPLQQGSDSRWVHPHIYDWPSAGSESFSAALPVLNWTASRASDVVVQVLREWKSLVESRNGHANGRSLRFYCNTRHLQVTGLPSSDNFLHIEWVGEPRQVADPSVPLRDESPGGAFEQFDMVLMAVGFGLESGQTSYWRNEELAQPHLGQATMTYIVSGAGDGAMIDLFRLRIAQFRQDRILAELFEGRSPLLERLRSIARRADRDVENVFQMLNDLWDPSQDLNYLTDAVTKDLASRLRRDTRVILHVRPSRFADLFERNRVSFQNRLLAFLLYKAGGFHPSSEDIETLAAEHDVPAARIIRRHGPSPSLTLKTALAKDLHPLVESAIADNRSIRQGDQPKWTGGYFDVPGASQREERDDNVRARWRKEYLPGPTQAIVTAFCAALAGNLRQFHAEDKRLRVTVHRTLLLGAEAVLQQCCEYQGVRLDDEPGGSAGRTFPANAGTIGAAFVTRKLVCSQVNAGSGEFQEAMAALDLNYASRAMSSRVGAVAALPLISFGDDVIKGRLREKVVGVLYMDSDEPEFFNDLDRMANLISMTREFICTLRDLSSTSAGNLANNDFWLGEQSARTLELPTDPAELVGLEIRADEVVRVRSAPYLNFDYSDFARVEVQ
ncbi:FAD-dependent oxidoreductase [Amycolatopsis sp. NPDC051371]|uniref:FAD-dependent oxidoreductase n=1 Tax=Amycolatopsis sp. NPDC051371 TaxID=3155800 RepID=UPI003419EF1C